MDTSQNNQRARFEKYEKPVSEFTDKVMEIKRVSKKTKGGNQVSFTALVVSGDKKSRVGLGHARAKSVADAIAKAIKKAQKSLVSIPIVNGTISTAMTLKFKGAIVMLRPGKKGSGLIAGGPVRAVIELAGIQDLVSKIIGSKNKSVNVMATFKALKSL
ncbi:30S ribosomal protein S5 [Candidatus Shapirobacteria bacterium CG10_big_fil_rev_8_21_14_0_10_36_6]|uniref:Small ribosomal subunit protein uS5 n=6 Tax=Candidatus Shapironibacteriota TaxID=1752721 RepID=A0A1J5I3H8_9BACT|nr:MAG: 30S ribosomal protein S5 [Candidatus Shapirobacteria bacterium CG2_30_35_20]PIV07251.1 MAG: 30S ribosomal protein S5 [Candidatus Shapirobacteria bacterium CG03_land_8_20_14_0_80_35_14]PIX68164.1 MAG: 30S ribosomal protein S5 [Candidatus Shapirobacteria bacterium CG_4_10_14_3_um_filter_35_13]PJE66682.1 MAG: 30S ribosomal protein S5 [Candidatus Shapirobacteria bacterium CG10_big_fil_rev_8_21_14_0_10_36_6]